MKLETSRLDDVTILSVSGEFNTDSLGRFSSAVDQAQAGGCCDFVVDIKGVTTVDSAALQVLTALQRHCDEHLGMMRLAGADDTMVKILEITRLNKVLTLCGNTEEALASFKQV